MHVFTSGAAVLAALAVLATSGAAHVLELASQLNLTPTQRVDSQALFDSMQERAKALGRELVDEERTLDGLFANGTVTPQLLENSLAKIASLQARLRGTHLEAHLAQASILTSEQNAHYAQLRGYGGAPEHRDHGGR